MSPSRVRIPPSPPRRGGRAVECGGLENRYPSLGGSRVQIPPPPLRSRIPLTMRGSTSSTAGVTHVESAAQDRSSPPERAAHWRATGAHHDVRAPLRRPGAGVEHFAGRTSASPQWPGRSRRYPGARAFLVAFSAMAESAASASWCPRPPTAATAEAATAASSIDSLSSSSSNRSSHRTANRTAAPAHAGRQVPSAPAPRRATAGRAPAPLPRRWRRCRTVNQVASPDG